MGTTIEWYDFFLYGTAAALVFPKLFFPTFDPFVGTLLAFSTYAVGFAARPIGGIVIGHYGDKVGRKSMLVLTLITNGGIVEVPVYLELTAIPFAQAPFQRVVTPRQLAERMRAHPKAAIPLLESGAVARWFDRFVSSL